MDYWKHNSVTVTSEPAVEPVTVQDIKNYGRIDTDADDDVIKALIGAVRLELEKHANCAFVTQTRRVQLQAWPNDAIGIIRLPFSPVQSISSVQYYDADDTLQTWSSDNYDVDTDSLPGIVARKNGVSWPTHRTRINPVRVTYVCGYGDDADSVPQAIRVAIMAGVMSLYERRETDVDNAASLRGNPAVMRLINPYRIRTAG